MMPLSSARPPKKLRSPIPDLSLVEMKNEGRAKSDQKHFQFRARRRPNEGIHGFDQLLKADDLAIKVRFVESIHRQ